MLSKKILEMPKIDLHCHLDGSLPLATISDLAGREVSLAEVRAADDCASLREYLKKFDLPLSCMQTSAGLRRAAGDFLRSLTKDHICYAEVRFAPMLSVNEHLDCRQVMEAVLSGLAEASEECGIICRTIVCTMRHHSAERNCRMLRECREFLGEGLCAADLAGDEAGFPTEDFAEVLGYAHRLGYPLTIHAGECGNADSVRAAIEFGAQRIGHGIAMAGHPDLQKLCRQKRIGIEMCPVSNYQTKALRAGETYPLREFAENGLLVTVNTDNRTVSGTQITRELAFLQERIGLTEEEILCCQRNAAEVSFADDAVRQELWKIYR